MPTLEQVLEKNPKTVRMVFKNMPLTQIHKFAMNATVSAMAAERQGKFWPYHDKLFENFSKLDDQMIDNLAKEVGLDMVRFNKDRVDPKIRQLVDRDMQEARQSGVRGTPTIFINGRLLKNRSLEGFQEEIDKEVAKAAKGGK